MTNHKTENDVKTAWVVIDIGCHECGVDSEPVGIYTTQAEARAARDECDKRTKRWRDGGKTYAVVFKMTFPSNKT